MSFASRSRAAFALASLLALSGVMAATQTAVLPLSGMGEKGEAPVYWDFRIDAGRGAGKWTRIRVPSCWEQEGFGTYYYGTQGRGKPDGDAIFPKERGEYRTDFVVPAEWRGQQVRIVFEAAMTDTTVRVNGQLIRQYENHANVLYCRARRRETPAIGAAVGDEWLAPDPNRSSVRG